MPKTSELLDTDLLDFLESRDDWYSLTKYRGRYHIEHQTGWLGPFFSLRGVLLSFQEAVTKDES